MRHLFVVSRRLSCNVSLSSHKHLHIATSPSPLSWSQVNAVRRRSRLLATSASRRKLSDHLWATPLKFKDPEFDIEYLLDPINYDAIKENIGNRKGVGDIDLVIDLWNRLSKENDDGIKKKLKEDLLKAAAAMPNLSHPKSPIGDEDQAHQIDLVGTKKKYPYPVKTMVELGERLRMLRTSNVNLTTGPGTYYFTDQLAQLEQALVQYTLDYLLDKGFELVSVPDLLRPDIIESCGFQTSGDVTQVYRLDPARHGDFCLAGTAEMALAGYFIDEEVRFDQLPIKLAAVSRCYRAETSHVDQESGIYRVHQFTKVEMFGVTANETGEESENLLEEFINLEKALFSKLGLHFRVLDMPTSELGAPAYRKFDIETWMPAKEFWGEISSASNCTDYQSRRLGIRYSSPTGQLKHCHTINGTACAVPRTIMALCESLQQQNGSIQLPAVLWKYMDGARSITASSRVPAMVWSKSNKLKK